jgi:hypothetical protein
MNSICQPRKLEKASYHDFCAICDPESAFFMKLALVVPRTAFLENRKEVAFAREMNPWYWCITILGHSSI